MNCLVTGGAGFIGSHVADALINAGHHVTIVDNLSTGSRNNIHPKATFFDYDINQDKFWRLIGRVNCIFHLASLARIKPSIDDPIEAHEVNVNGTLKVLEYCKKNRAKIIFSSSSSLYKGLNLPSGEDDEFDLKNPYTLQKYVCEQYIELYHKLYDLEYAILRYFNVFGERQILEGEYAAIVGIFIRQREETHPLTITFDGEQRRDFTYVKDVAQANVMAMDWEGTFNIGTGQNYSINQIADMVGGRKHYIGDREGEARNTLANIKKARNKGWKPTINILEWYEST